MKILVSQVVPLSEKNEVSTSRAIMLEYCSEVIVKIQPQTRTVLIIGRMSIFSYVAYLLMKGLMS